MAEVNQTVYNGATVYEGSVCKVTLVHPGFVDLLRTSWPKPHKVSHSQKAQYL